MEEENLLAKLFNSQQNTVQDLFDDYLPKPKEGITEEELVRSGLGFRMNRAYNYGQKMSKWSGGSGLPSEINQQLSEARANAVNDGGITGYGYARGKASKNLHLLNQGNQTQQRVLNQMRDESAQKLQKLNQLLQKHNAQSLGN